MTRWELDVPAIRRVIKTTESDRDDLSTAIREKDTLAIEEGLGWGGPLLDPLREAVGALMVTQGEDVMTIRNHVAAGILGLTNATLAYRSGQTQMLDTLQREMLRSADTGDFGYWMRHGLTD